MDPAQDPGPSPSTEQGSRPICIGSFRHLKTFSDRMTRLKDLVRQQRFDVAVSMYRSFDDDPLLHFQLLMYMLCIFLKTVTDVQRLMDAVIDLMNMIPGQDYSDSMKDQLYTRFIHTVVINCDIASVFANKIVRIESLPVDDMDINTVLNGVRRAFEKELASILHDIDLYGEEAKTSRLRFDSLLASREAISVLKNPPLLGNENLFEMAVLYRLEREARKLYDCSLVGSKDVDALLKNKTVSSMMLGEKSEMGRLLQQVLLNSYLGRPKPGGEELVLD